MPIFYIDFLHLFSDAFCIDLFTSKVFSFLVFSELYEHHCNTSTGKVLFTAAKMLCQMLEADVPMVLPQDADLPALIHGLACQAITVCNSGRDGGTKQKNV